MGHQRIGSDGTARNETKEGVKLRRDSTKQNEKRRRALNNGQSAESQRRTDTRSLKSEGPRGFFGMNYERRDFMVDLRGQIGDMSAYARTWARVFPLWGPVLNLRGCSEEPFGN